MRASVYDYIQSLPDKRNAESMQRAIERLFKTGTVAAAGSAQSDAASLANAVNICTGADGTKGVRLLDLAVDDPVTVVNTSTTSALKVYPAVGSTINALSANASISVPADSAATFWATGATQVYTPGADVGSEIFNNLTLTGALTESSTNAITAFATGGQASATALTTDINRITVCATAGDSVKLPTAAAGRDVVVINDGATAADVFPATGDAINGQAVNIAVRLKPGSLVFFTCSVAGAWNVSLPNPRFLSLAASGAVAVQAETIFATNQYTIVANSLKLGTRIKIRGQGTVATANGTLQVRVRYGGVGGVLILDTGNAITPSNGDIFQFDGEFVVTDVGATGHIYGCFMWTIGTSGTGTMRAGKTASIAIDTTADKVLNVTQQNGTGAGSLTLDYLSVSIE